MRYIASVVILLVLALGNISAVAQVEGTLHYMNSLPQVVVNNPAFVPKYKFSLGLPFSSIYEGYTNNGFSYNDLITRKDGVVNVDLAKWSKSLPEKTYISPAASVDILRLGFRTNEKLYVTLNVTNKEFGYFILPKGMTSLLVDGNAPYIGKTVNISPALEAISYLETAVGASYEVNDKLTVGGRVKLLHGIANLSTQKSDIALAFDDNYNITASADLQVQTSGVQSLTGDNYDPAKEWRNYMKNRGLALDIGATYKLIDKLTLNASIIDLGGISWKNDLYQYSLNKSEATYTFSGIDAAALVNGTASDYIEAQKDSIQEHFKLQEGTVSSFSTALATKVFLGANFEIIKNLNVGTVFFTERFRERISPGWTLSVNKHFGKAISTSFSYTASNRSYNNFGAGLSFNLAPFQLYVVGDNLLRIPSSLIVHKELNNYINTAQIINVRLGLNFVMGWGKGLAEEKAKPVNSKKSGASKARQNKRR